MITLLLLLLVFVAYVLGELAALRKRVAHVEERVGVTHGSPATSTATARPPITTAPPASPAPLERDVRRPVRAPAAPAAAPPVSAPTAPVAPPPVTAAAAPITVPPRASAATSRPRPSEPALSLEERIGSVWLRNIGLVLLAIGVAYFVNVVHVRLTPAEKIAVAYAFALAVFALGASQQRRLERFARPLMISGLTLAYFVSFAAHFVAATRCVSLPVALVWMIADLVPVFVLADRWQSQPAAGLAIFLGHVSAFVASNRGDMSSLAAITLLAMLAVALHLRHAWPPLSLFALGGSYVSHLVWILFGRTGAGDALTVDELRLNVAFLTSYYVIFAAADLAWWQRAGWRAAHHDRDGLTARALGPANLVAYVALVSLFYTQTPAAAGIEWFFFALAAVQTIMRIIHRRLGNPDAELYTALAVVFATVGLCARVDAIALSEVLAVEALVLLVAAHRTRLWIFHLLAQASLALNFAHYWLLRPATESFPTFLGGLLIVIVYLVEASLEERWYAEGSDAEWRGGASVGPVLRPLVRAFTAIYSPLAPRLAAVHAVVGAVMLVREVVYYFGASGALRALAVALLVLPAVARVSRGRVLLMAAVVVQAAVAIVSVGDPWSAWAAATAGWLAILGLVVTEPRAGRADLGIVRALLVVATLALFPLAFDLPARNGALHLAWMTTVALVAATYDRIAAWRATDDPSAARLRRAAATVTLVVAGPLVWEVVVCASASAPAALYWLRVWGVAFVAAGLGRRDGILLTAAAAAMGGSLPMLALPASFFADSSRIATTLRWWLPALDWCVACVLLFAAPRRLAGSVVRTAGGVAQAIVAIGVAGAATVALGAPPATIAALTPWIVALAIGFASEERAGRIRGGAAPDVVALALLLALVLWGDVAGAVPTPMREALWLQVLGVVLCAAAALRRHVGLYVAGAMLVLATYAVVFALHPFDLAARDPTAFVIVALTLGLALSQDAFLARAPAALQPIVAVGTLVPYALALLLWTSEVGNRAGIGWAQPARAALVVALLIAATRVRGTIGTAVAIGYLLLVELHATLAWSSAEDVLVPALALGAEAIAFERYLQAKARNVAVPAVAERAARAASIALAVVAVLVAIYWSRVFATDHTWVTIGWSVLAGVIMALGFAFRAAEYRRTALATLAICLLRALVVDTQRLGDIAKPITFVLLASCSLTAAWLYSRYAPRIKDWL